MENEDMSEIIKKLSGMLNNSNVPDNIMDMLNNMQNNNSSNTSNTTNSNDISSENTNIDMDTILKISKIISKMNSSGNDSRANLLLSLKPYLKESRKNKVEQYIKLLNMSKVLEVFNSNGDEKVK